MSELDACLALNPKGRCPTRSERRANQPGGDHVGGGVRRNDVGREQHEEKRTRGRKEEQKTKIYAGETYSGVD